MTEVEFIIGRTCNVRMWTQHNECYSDLLSVTISVTALIQVVCLSVCLSVNLLAIFLTVSMFFQYKQT